MLRIIMEIEKLVKLARINLSSEEKGKLQKEFEAILNYISALKEADTGETAAIGKSVTANVLRKDESENEEKAKPKNLVAMAPVHENILIKGKICAAGSKMLQNYKASYDATAIKKLKDAGAVLLGRTNMDEFAMGASTENSAYGVT